MAEFNNATIIKLINVCYYNMDVIYMQNKMLTKTWHGLTNLSDFLPQLVSCNWLFCFPVLVVLDSFFASISPKEVFVLCSKAFLIGH